MSKSNELLQTLHIASEEMRWRILEALASGPKTSSVLAREMSLTPQHINFHTGKLEDAGLLKVAYVDPPEGGMKVKEYRLIPCEWTIKVSPKGATITSKPAKA